MRLLLDTHAFLWYITEDSRLTPPIANVDREFSHYPVIRTA